MYLIIDLVYLNFFLLYGVHKLSGKDPDLIRKGCEEGITQGRGHFHIRVFPHFSKTQCHHYTAIQVVVSTHFYMFYIVTTQL